MNETKSYPGGAAIPRADYYEAKPEFHVFSWSPSPPGQSGPVTQVHVHIGTPPGFVALVRVKNAATLDSLIDALKLHREDVWGPRNAGPDYEAGLEKAASLHESVNPASDEERLRRAPGAGAMGAVIEYRDLIRNEKAKKR